MLTKDWVTCAHSQSFAAAEFVLPTHRFEWYITLCVFTILTVVVLLETQDIWQYGRFLSSSKGVEEMEVIQLMRFYCVSNKDAFNT